VKKLKIVNEVKKKKLWNEKELKEYYKNSIIELIPAKVNLGKISKHCRPQKVIWSFWFSWIVLVVQDAGGKVSIYILYFLAKVGGSKTLQHSTSLDFFNS